MAELEKVIKAWECCNPFNRRCFKCPYDADCFHDSFDRVAIADMVILLKERQPRLLTLEEVKQAEVVWNEWTSVDGFVECMMFDRVDADGDYRFTEKLGSQIYFEPSEYNESWRCWSARPTAEQMQETGWDGEKE